MPCDVGHREEAQLLAASRAQNGFSLLLQEQGFSFCRLLCWLAVSLCQFLCVGSSCAYPEVGISKYTEGKAGTECGLMFLHSPALKSLAFQILDAPQLPDIFKQILASHVASLCSRCLQCSAASPCIRAGGKSPHGRSIQEVAFLINSRHQADTGRSRKSYSLQVVGGEKIENKRRKMENGVSRIIQAVSRSSIPWGYQSGVRNKAGGELG